jgi:lipooligosaccharide transport system permease protein
MAAAGSIAGAGVGWRSRLTAHRSLRVLEYNLLLFRQGWYNYLLSGLTQPLLTLVSLGIGLGLYVNAHGNGILGGVPYMDFIAPALMMAQAMIIGAGGASWPIMAKIQWDKQYVAALNTPLGVQDLLLGEVFWIAFRTALLSTLFLVVIVVVGAAASPLVVLSVPVAVLTALAFAAPMLAFTATQTGDSGYTLFFRFGVTPLFLFSGTYFPVDQLPVFLQPLAWVTPLYHGVSAARSLSVGQIDPLGLLIHPGVLSVFAGVGIAVGRVTFRRRLEY